MAATPRGRRDQPGQWALRVTFEDGAVFDVPADGLLARWALAYAEEVVDEKGDERASMLELQQTWALDEVTDGHPTHDWRRREFFDWLHANANGLGLVWGELRGKKRRERARAGEGPRDYGRLWTMADWEIVAWGEAT